MRRGWCIAERRGMRGRTLGTWTRAACHDAQRMVKCSACEYDLQGFSLVDDVLADHVMLLAVEDGARQVTNGGEAQGQRGQIDKESHRTWLGS